MVITDKIRYVPKGANDDTTQDVCIAACDECMARHASMCSALKKNKIHHLSKISKQVIYKPKQSICAEGDKADYIYNIQGGCIRISKMLSDGRRQIIGFLFAGDFFGLSCSNGYSYSAESITSVELCKMPRSEILKKFDELPVLSQKVLSITQTELQNAAEQMLLLGRKSAKEKLSSFLLAMSDKSSQTNKIPQGKIFLPMSRSDIADYLGLTIETISRQFTILAKDGVILIDDNTYVTILDEERLKLIASGE